MDAGAQPGKLCSAGVLNQGIGHLNRMGEFFCEHAKALQKVDAFVAWEALVFGVGLQIYHLAYTDTENHPGTGQAGSERQIKCSALNLSVVFNGIQDSILLGMECKIAASPRVAFASCFGPFLIAVVCTGRRAIVSD